MADVQRLVYSPKCWAYVKNTKEEIMDLQEYVIGGEIGRKLNQVSTAKLTLRNPDRIFTRPGEVAFHPMDPITIFLERTPGHPVQVFTGFLDKCPYYQMRPGPITLEASCTLKKLLYTWYQLAQPYTLSLLKHFGWEEAGSVNSAGEPVVAPGGVPGMGGAEGLEEGQGEELAAKWKNKAGETGFQQSQNGVPFGVEKGGQYATNDGSFANLLWAILTFIGDWKDEKIWIEDVPSSVPKLINKLWNDFEQNDKEAQEDAVRFWAAAIGTSSHGKGGGSGGGEGKGTPTGNLTNTKEVVETMTTIAKRFNLPPEFVICTSLCECGFNQKSITSESEGAQGWFQFQFAGKPTDTPYGGKSYTKAEAEDTSIATEAFCEAAVMRSVEQPSLKEEGNWEDWAKKTQGSEGYPGWTTELVRAKRLISQYPITSKPPLAGGLGEEKSNEPEETQRNSKETKGKTGSAKRTRLDVMESRASEITNKQYPYSYGGGHAKAGDPSMGTETETGGSEVNGYDCSGSVGAILAAGAFIPPGSPVPPSGNFGNIYGSIGEPGPGPKGKGVTIYWSAGHEWMTIKGRYFSTGWDKKSNPKEGAGWGGEQESEWPSPTAPPGPYNSIHLKNSELEEPYTGPLPPALAGTEGETEGESKGSSGASILSQASAAAFASNISFPSSEARYKAQIFGGQKSLINATPLLPFVQQVCQASLRSFQSLPNGDFYAFYPDYFGEFGHHDAYWLIDDIEILEGGIELNDENLVTHVFSLGNPIYPANPSTPGVSLVIEEKAGMMTIFEAMTSEGVLYNLEQEEIDLKRPGVAGMMNYKEAVEFIQRYGPRVSKEEFPLVTSPIYECLLAWQQFLLGWSRQFETPFTFTFMPELFPGGKVGFPAHGIQMFIEEVTHTWDTTNGYQTVAKLTAPSVLYVNEKPAPNEEQIPPNMVDASIEPLRDETKAKATAPTQRPALPIKTNPKTNAENSKAFGGNNPFQTTGI